MDIRLAKGAKREFEDAYFEYELDRKGLGVEFRVEITRILGEISRRPLSWPVVVEDVHRCLPRRFPYAVLYQVRKTYIYIIAIMHTSRRPGYWRARVTKK